jgi:hypothetical protein
MKSPETTLLSAREAVYSRNLQKIETETFSQGVLGLMAEKQQTRIATLFILPSLCSTPE